MNHLYIMVKIQLLPFYFLVLFISCMFSFQNNILAQHNTVSKLKKITTNENVLAKTLVYTNWRAIETIYNSSYDDLKNILINELNNRSNMNLSELQSLSDDGIADGVLMCKFLFDSGIRSASELATMNLDDYRNTIISWNHDKTGINISTLQGYDNKHNLNIAYGWWFKENTVTANMINQLNDVTKFSYKFDSKDNRSVNLEVLKIAKADEGDFTYLGVYQSMVSANHFKLYLAGSNNLLNWYFITELGDRAHQGDIKKWGSGYILANEQDVIEGSNNIQIRYYASYDDLKNNIPANIRSIERTLAPSAEGTPDVRIISGDSPTDSYLLIGFHFYMNNDVDQQAFGILKNFCEWRSWEDVLANNNLRELMNYQGNLGGRSSFVFGNNTYVLQEAQIEKYQWDKWRLMFGDGTYYVQLDPITPKGSTSFANPGIEHTVDAQFIVTSFMPTEGNQVGEIGEMIYKVNFNQ